MMPLPRVGQLLVASPLLRDPNFERTVVLMLEVTAERAVGVVINRPTDLFVEQVLPTWATCAAPPAVFFTGGPVSPHGALAFARGPLTGVGIPRRLDGLVPVDLGQAGPGDGDGVSRVFAGYAGWGPEQLDAEMEAGGWIVADREENDVFSSAPEALWAAVLQRQRSDVALLARYPNDPGTN